ncbi:hypothetical protein BpHYR1_006450 [Brachionus plicatilis]|uniref:Uncharacterized protein n=1 Tax=Brachionus plicatilis TaxID=10195 RepID=A0A3M7Q152_BRAPC|nr:hypothetical protein BpHYR1_006450 [Brachionus plicatilis]
MVCFSNNFFYLLKIKNKFLGENFDLKLLLITSILMLSFLKFNSEKSNLLNFCVYEKNSLRNFFMPN